MKRTVFVSFAMALAALSFAQPSLAQQYKWIDKDGRTQYGDTPPAGAKATPLKAPSRPASAPAPEGKAAAKDAKKGPLTPAEQDAEFRKRQAEAQKSSEKDEKAAQEQEAKRANCSSSQEQLRMLESGQRVGRTNANGERYFIDDDQRAADVAKARKGVSDWCS
jgi:Skp family chaperone for outer membrane proteins